ncbi:Predicted arabinose efflux permease, MFS family [Arthrobacter subterraneus]|uniref:Predicted arabinose efflux permease, MFS family n=2 Tax=Arthrobacter TaxID=1663 RepID=A0A1G8FRH6_9MICC|nr:MFS transporter [Arthrobacter subterraneus]SDH84740.1 Predicted arabinose efflux permease, MFS family [Arthrobacter subterraneus]
MFQPEAVPSGGAMSASLRPLTIGVIAIITCAAFEAMAVVTAMPAVAAELDGVSSYGLAFSMYLTASLLGSVLGGIWSDRRGPRPALASGLGLMVAGLAISGTAPAFWIMTSGRAVSGLGGGFMIVAVYVIIARAYPQRMQPVVFGWLAAAWVVPSLIGPYISGVLAEQASWRWVFLGVAPVVVAAFLLVWPRTAQLAVPRQGGPLDSAARGRVAMGLLLAAGVFAAQFALTRIAADGFADPVPAWLLVVLGVAGTAAAAVAFPRLLPAGTVRLAPGLPSVIATRGLLTVTFFGAEAFVPLMLVSARGLSASTAGLALSAAAIGWSAGSFVQARVSFRRQWLLVIGASLLSLCIGGLALAAAAQVPFWVLVVVWSAAGFAMGLTLSSTSVLVLKLSPPHEQGRNSAALQLSDQLGGVIGTAGAGGLFALLRDPEAPGQVPVFVAIWLALCVFAVVGIVAGLRATRGDRDPLPATSETRKVPFQE